MSRVFSIREPFQTYCVWPHDISNPVQKRGFVPGTKWAKHENLTTHLHLALILQVRGAIVTYISSYVVWQIFLVERHEEDPTSEDTVHSMSWYISTVESRVRI